MDDALHPTARALVATTVAIIEANGPQSVTIDKVLDASGISRGSLYHHFGDFPSLVDHALLSIFRRYADAAVVELNAALEELNSLESFRDGIHAIHAMNNTPEAARTRVIRTWAVAQALVRPSLRDLLAEHQMGYNAALLAIIERGKERGWLRTEVDASSLALLVQAYSFGTSLDELTDDHVDRAAYANLLDEVMVRTMFTDEARAALE